MRFFRIPFNSDDESGSAEVRPNRLQKYIHAQSAQDMSRLASEIGPEVRQIIGANVQALLGYLPNQDFNTTVVASKENLQNLLASAMLTGYFMHAMEVRMQMDELFSSQSESTSDAISEAIAEAISEAVAEAGSMDAAELLQRPETLFRLGPEAKDAPAGNPVAQAPGAAAPLEGVGGRFLDSSEFGTDQGPQQPSSPEPAHNPGQAADASPDAARTGDQSLEAAAEVSLAVPDNLPDNQPEQPADPRLAQSPEADPARSSSPALKPELAQERLPELRFEALDAPFHAAYEAQPSQPAGLADPESARISGRISGRISDKFDVQLEINTHMNRAELTRLLRELREFQSSEDEPDTGTY